MSALAIKDLVRCPLAEAGECGQQDSWMVWAPGGIAPSGAPWNDGCEMPACPYKARGDTRSRHTPPVQSVPHRP